MGPDANLRPIKKTQQKRRRRPALLLYKKTNFVCCYTKTERGGGISPANEKNPSYGVQMVEIKERKEMDYG